ncbi:hypothetical protein ElyMa_003410600 [Elysia marginata]|uniref:Uncharacterized protein n=1 Tax=Elysia marginata TaxID=1093978 RepID=A0AAV4JQ50_9GAST|nr:hypothetical protein ElyMa_003410600 [Elysia marginata]
MCITCKQYFPTTKRHPDRSRLSPGSFGQFRFEPQKGCVQQELRQLASQPKSFYTVKRQRASQPKPFYTVKRQRASQPKPFYIVKRQRASQPKPFYIARG